MSATTSGPISSRTCGSVIDTPNSVLSMSKTNSRPNGFDPSANTVVPMPSSAIRAISKPLDIMCLTSKRICCSDMRGIPEWGTVDGVRILYGCLVLHPPHFLCVRTLVHARPYAACRKNAMAVLWMRNRRFAVALDDRPDKLLWHLGTFDESVHGTGNRGAIRIHDPAITFGNVP